MKPGKPLARTPFKRTSPMPSTGMLSVQSHQRTAPKRKAGLKSKGPVSTPIRCAARGQDCTLRLAVCNFDPDTTVLCHSNFLADGKGMGLKAPDSAACFGCSDCHDVLDGRRPLPGWITRQQLDDTFDRAVAITQEQLKQEGLIA